MIKCNSCNQTLDDSEFFERKNRPSRKQPCRECIKISRRTPEYRSKMSKYRQRKRIEDPRFFVRQQEKARYGITKEDFDVLECYICKNEDNLNIDHCHTTGRVRGLLCTSCNVALGSLGDDIRGIEKVLEYLKSWKEYPA